MKKAFAIFIGVGLLTPFLFLTGGAIFGYALAISMTLGLYAYGSHLNTKEIK